MSTISSKEKNMLLVGVTVVLYGVAALCYKAQMPKWKATQKRYATAETKLKDERALIAAREDWKSEYETMRGLMPSFPYDKDMNTYWQRVMETSAKEEQVSINRQQAKDEVEVGDVYEMPIDCKDWEASLESLVRFLYLLSIQEGAMMDVRQLYIKPTNKPGILKGTFTLYCAYMKDN